MGWKSKDISGVYYINDHHLCVHHFLPDMLYLDFATFMIPCDTGTEKIPSFHRSIHNGRRDLALFCEDWRIWMVFKRQFCQILSKWCKNTLRNRIYIQCWINDRCVAFPGDLLTSAMFSYISTRIPTCNIKETAKAKTAVYSETSIFEWPWHVRSISLF